MSVTGSIPRTKSFTWANSEPQSARPCLGAVENVLRENKTLPLAHSPLSASLRVLMWPGTWGCSAGGSECDYESPPASVPYLLSLPPFSSSHSLCHPRGGHQQPEEAGGEIREGVGPCDYHPQGLGHVWGPQLPTPHDHTLLYQCERPPAPTSPWGRGSRRERRNGEGPRGKAGLGVGKWWDLGP